MILYPGQEYDRNLSIAGSVFFSMTCLRLFLLGFCYCFSLCN